MRSLSALGIQLLDRATNVVAAHGEDTREP